MDLKTSKALFPEHMFQVAAYHSLLMENGYRVDGVRLLRVGRSEDEGFEDHIISGDTLKEAWRVFQAALALYRAKQDFDRLERRAA